MLAGVQADETRRGQGAQKSATEVSLLAAELLIPLFGKGRRLATSLDEQGVQIEELQADSLERVASLSRSAAISKSFSEGCKA
jgi:hypothetical protein